MPLAVCERSDAELSFEQVLKVRLAGKEEKVADLRKRAVGIGEQEL